MASLQDQLKKMAFEIQRAIKDDDGDHWFHHVGSETQGGTTSIVTSKNNPVTIPSDPYNPESTAIEGLRVLRADVVFRSNDMAEMSTGLLSPPSVSLTEARAVTSRIGSPYQVGESNPYGEVRPAKSKLESCQSNQEHKSIPSHSSPPPPKTPEEDTTVDIAAPDCTEDGGHSPRQGSAAIFPEIMQAIEVEPNQEGHEPLVTVTQVIKGVHDVQIPQQGTEFEASLSQWMVASTLDLAKTPLRGMLRERVEKEVGQSVQQGVDSCLRRLQDQFDEEKDMATNEHVGYLSHTSSCSVDGHHRAISISMGDGLSVDSRGGTFLGGSFDCRIMDAKVFKGNTLWEVYSQLQIDALLKAVPTQGKGTVRKKETVFFNHCGKELTLKHKDIWELKNSKVRLGNDVVDFVLSRIYMAYPEDRRHEIHMVSSRVSAYMLLVTSHAKSAEKFARDWLQPPDGVEVHQVKELIVPWVCDDHWSVLVFQPNRVFHMDSCYDVIHKPRDKHFEVLKWMSYAWRHLRGVEEYPVGDIININVFQQVGDNECGHLCIRNIMLYLKVRWFHVLLYG